jgi:hypothetical protein
MAIPTPSSIWDVTKNKWSSQQTENLSSTSQNWKEFPINKRKYWNNIQNRHRVSKIGPTYIITWCVHQHISKTGPTYEHCWRLRAWLVPGWDLTRPPRCNNPLIGSLHSNLGLAERYSKRRWAWLPESSIQYWQKPVGFHENRQNLFGLVLSVYQKPDPLNLIFLKKSRNFEIKILKN